ncbi:MAG: DinB family protein [Actinomycetota bacterium]
MISPELCLRMAQYNRWMNERLYALCADLADGARKEDRQAVFRSMHGTLNHLMVGDRIWMGRFVGPPFTVASLDTELHSDFQELRTARQKLDAEILTWAESLDEARLAAEFSFTTMVNPMRRTMPLWFAVQHFYNHQTHHRGQLTTLLSQAGVDIGVTDLLLLPEAPVRLIPADA